MTGTKHSRQALHLQTARINEGKVEHLGMHAAKDWGGRDPELWAVVVAPWVIVQERKN